MTSTVWCEWAWLGGAQAVPGVAIAIDDDRITSVAHAAGPPLGARRLAGLTLPGIANAHSHAFQRLLRGRTHAGAGDFWAWRDAMYDAVEGLDPDRFHAVTRACFTEMAQAGWTCVGEFHYLHHDRGGTAYRERNVLGRAVVDAATEVGLRLTLLDTCYGRGGDGQGPSGAQRRFVDGSFEAWAARVAELDGDGALGPTARLGAAVHSVRACDEATIASVAAWAQRRGAPLHVHLSEQPAENEACRREHGCTPTALLARAGALGPRTAAVHAIHLAADDVAALGAAGATVVACPTTERDLADGIAPTEALVAAGARLAVGSDSQVVVDPFEEARGVEAHQRLRSGRRGVHAVTALARALTVDGYRALGWDGGRLVAGAPADLVTVGLDSVRLAGSRAGDVLAAVVLGAAAPDVRTVVVAGRTIVEEGRHVGIDAASALRAALS